jgi:type IV secretion system protein VirB10
MVTMTSRLALVMTGVLVASAPAEAGMMDTVRSWMGLSSAETSKPDTSPPPPALVDLFPTNALLAFDRTQVTVDGVSGAVELTVKRSSSFGSAVRVHWETAPVAPGISATGPAEAGKDFQSVAGDLVFAADEKEKTVRIPIFDPGVWRGDRAFHVFLTSPKSATLKDGSGDAVVTIHETRSKPSPVVPGQLVAEVSDVDFGSLELGQEVERDIVLRNSGGEAVTVQRAEVSSRGAFVVSQDGCARAPLAAGAECRVQVTFQPDLAQTVTGTLLVPWDAPSAVRGKNGVIRMEVSGTGVAPPPPIDPMAERVAAASAARRQNGAVYSFDDEPKPPESDPASYKMRDKDYSDLKLDQTVSSFPVNRERMITTDRYIPCVLETAINSQLAGGVICVVESHVYGSDGRRVLIPAGTRVEGDYQPLGKNGESRLNVIWRRFLRPDGASIYVKSGFQAMDQAGRTGVPGEIDNRWWEKYGSALFVTGLAAASAFATGGASGSTGMGGASTGLQAAQQTGSEGMLKITQQMIEQNIDLRPVSNVAAGTRLIIRPMIDVALRSPELMDAAGGPAASPPDVVRPPGSRVGG